MTVEDQPSGSWVYNSPNNADVFTITITNKCKTDTITLGTPGSGTLTTYSGATQSVTGLTFTHSDNTSPCNTYHTKLVEVSADNGATWFSTGRTYTDLLASDN